MEFLGAIGDLLFSAEGRIPEGAPAPLLVFATSAAIMGLLVVLLDWLTAAAKGRSFLGVRWGGGSALRMVVLWGIGAGVGGFMAVAADILQTGRLACVTIGVAWPLVLPRLIDSTGEDEEEGGGS